MPKISHAFQTFAVLLTVCSILLAACNPAAVISPTLTPTIGITSTPTWPPTPTLVPTQTRTPWPADAASLRTLADKRNFFIGAAVQSKLIANEAPYRDTLKREFNLLTPEWEMKMCAIWPARDKWDFAASDAMVQFAQENGMRVRGHTLVWTECLPDWIQKGTFTQAEAAELLHTYITTVVSRYKGKIWTWDVLNETVERTPIWNSLIGPDYPKLAFQWAHEADPDAQLFYNDFNIEKPNDKFDSVLKFVKDLKDQGVPINGVGMQMHLGSEIPADWVAANMQKINDLGLQVQITEFDLPTDYTSKKAQDDQAKVYGNMLGACLKAKSCTAFVMWGFTDKYTWLIDNQHNANVDPLIFDKDYQPKPAYGALYNILQRP